MALRLSRCGLGLLAVCVAAATAWAGPNANGTLVVGLSVGTIFTGDNVPYCGSATAASCDGIVASTSQEGGVVLNVFAAFPPAASPRLSGLTFGVEYASGEGFSFADGGMCGDFELSEATWPASGSGTAVTWGAAETSTLTEVYWFGVYSYDSYGPGAFCLIPNPVQGANFADDDTPANVDPIAALGCFGFHGGNSSLPCPATETAQACCFDDGSCELLLPDDCEVSGGSAGSGPSCNPNPCPQPALGACCVDEECVIRTAADCLALGGEFAGDGTTCEGLDCGAIPTNETSWGRVKDRYR